MCRFASLSSHVGLTFQSFLHGGNVSAKHKTKPLLVSTAFHAIGTGMMRT